MQVTLYETLSHLDVFPGAVASCRTSGSAVLLCRTNLRGHCFSTGGEGTLRLWKVIPDRRQLETVDVKFGLIKRHIICIVVMYLHEEWKLFTFHKIVGLECYKS